MNLIDKWHEIFDPEKAVHRMRQRLVLDELRSYDAARKKRTTNYSRRTTRASDEVASGHRALAGGAQDLVRNTALANRIKAVIASNIVGTGIKPNYIGSSARRVKRYKSTFDEWANSTQCDYEGHTNFWGLQHLWAATVVESGGVFVRRVVNKALKFPLVLQTLEQQYLDEAKTGKVEDDGEIVNGIQFDRDGQITGYWLKTKLQGHYYREESQFFTAEDVVHIYWKDRPGQHLGVSWLHPIADLVDMRQEWRDAALLQQRIAACFGILIQEPDSTMGLDSQHTGIRDVDGNEFTEIEAGMIAYTSANSEVKTITPPNMNQSADFNSSIVQDIAVGVGVTREQLTGDFSKVTWASGRLARGEFYTNLDRWQQFMMIPGLDRIHDWFDELYTVIAGKPAISRNWIVPHRSAVNPQEDLEVDIRKVRTGAMTPQQFTQKYGLKFEEAITAWKEAKEVMGDLPFDFDPSKFSYAGNQLDDNDSASSNKKTDNKTTDTPDE